VTTFSCKTYIVFDWLHLDAELEPNPLRGLGTSVTCASSTFTEASIRLELLKSRDAVGLENEHEDFDVSDLAPGEERVISVFTGEEGDCSAGEVELDFVLTKGGRRPIRVRCKWHLARSEP
jgi:hypothetical protein